MSSKKTNIPPVNKPTAVPTAAPAVSEQAQGMPAHCAPCPPTFTLDAPLRWKAANPLEQKVLLNLQGNILKGHGRDNTWNIFFQLGNDLLKSRRVLRDLGNHRVTNAYKQLLESEAFKTENKPGGTFCAVFLSAKGYKKLEIEFAAAAGNDAFGQGMKHEESLKALGDPPDSQWEPPFQQELHGMVLIGDDDIARGSQAVAEVQAMFAGAGGTTHVQAGKAVRNAIGNGLEHFGYVDGRSQPLMLLEDIEKEARDEGIAHWDPTFPLSTALVQDPLAAHPDPDATGPDPLSFGSFFIFRKLEQNVRGFKTHEQDLADLLGMTGEDRERAGAAVVGRFEDGTPITMAGEARGIKDPRNDFDYAGDKDATRCLFHAHIRKTNPRGSGGFEKVAEERLHIMARRGITYEDTARVIHPEGLPAVDSRQEFIDQVQGHLPESGVGLLFMAYNAKLDNQFVFTQRQWANFAAFPKAPAPPGLDGVIGQNASEPGGQVHAKEWDDPAAGSEPFNFKGFVTMKGGEYFFAPSLTFLRDL